MDVPQEMAIGVVIVSHGRVAAEFLRSTEMIVGALPHFTAVCIGWHDEVSLARENIVKAIETVNQGRGVLMLADMFGSTPSNLALTFLNAESVEVVVGVNLPVLTHLAGSAFEGDLLMLARQVSTHGRMGIQVVSQGTVKP